MRYDQHHCPSHDLAGWRKERVPERPTGIMQVLPDWVCEITSPGHERKDVFHKFMLLQRHQVPHYWLISPEAKTLIAYQWDAGQYHVHCAVEYGIDQVDVLHIAPFEEIGIDMGYVFGGERC